jgi:hypothetical protein
VGLKEETLDGVTEKYFKNKMARDVQLGLQNRTAKPSLCYGRESWVIKEIRHKKTVAAQKLSDSTDMAVQQ